MVKNLGGIVLVAGIGLFIGNVSGAFVTFPGAGWITIIIGGAMLKAGGD
jgi:hypothetical protein